MVDATFAQHGLVVRWSPIQSPPSAPIVACPRSDDDAGVFGHYFQGQADPWQGVTYSTDASGVSEVDMHESSFTLYGSEGVYRRNRRE